MTNQSSSDESLRDQISKRIQIAEAMGWDKVKPYRGGIYGLPPGVRISPDAIWSEFCLNVPNPFGDANDDYAVLEWMRSHERQEHDDLPDGGYIRWSRFGKALSAGRVVHLSRDYKVGDYARAVLTVLCPTETDGE